MRVEVVRERCAANAVCIGIAPDLFDLDSDDYATVSVELVPSDQVDLARQSAQECPRAAILIHDEVAQPTK